MENEFLRRFINRIEDSEKVVSVADWVSENTHFPSGANFGYARHAFQRDIINDMHPNMCVKKLSQVGLTEVSIRKTIAFLARNPGTSALYTFPDGNMKKRNSQTRIKPIFDKDFPLVRNSTEIRNNDIMQLGGSFLYISANVESDATSTPVDMIINDEYDLSDQEFLALVNSRIQHSSFKIKQGFSTPTFSGYGISMEYESSDQREYWVQCPHCNHWQIPEYDLKNVYIPNLPPQVENLITDIDMTIAVSLDLDNAYCCCEKCRKRLPLGDDAKREWVARYPERLHSRGYWVRPFSSDLLSIRYLVTTMADYLKKNNLRRGVNTVLGMEYADSNCRLEREDIMKCMCEMKTPVLDKEKPCFIGIDVGTYCHITINTNDCDVVYFNSVPGNKLLDVLKDLDSRYKIVAGGMDRYPETNLSNQVRDWSKGRIQPIHYKVGGRDIEPCKGLTGMTEYYSANRTAALDFIKESVNVHKMKFYGYGNYQSTIIEHLRDMYRDDGRETQPVWIKMTGNDHFFHSLAYGFIARKILEYETFGGDDEPENSVVGLCGAMTDKKTLYTPNLLEYSTGKSRIITRSY